MTTAASEVVFVPGSLRAGSYTTRLLRFAESLLPEPFAVIEVDGVRSLPWYDADMDVAGLDAARQARSMLAGSAGVVISTPEYNGTIPGGLKNWYDWVTRPYREHVLVGKPITVIAASPGLRGAIGAAIWLRDSLTSAGAIVVGETIAIADVANQFDEHGLPSPAVAARLGVVMDALVRQMTPAPQ